MKKITFIIFILLNQTTMAKDLYFQWLSSVSDTQFVRGNNYFGYQKLNNTVYVLTTKTGGGNVTLSLVKYDLDGNRKEFALPLAYQNCALQRLGVDAGKNLVIKGEFSNFIKDENYKHYFQGITEPVSWLEIKV